VVLHGADDPLLMVGAGRQTAAAIPGAELRIIPGMGHDLPPGLYEIFIDAIDAAARRARAVA
jgi:pimeloyl-ACP methyl ester carboxylesterase